MLPEGIHFKILNRNIFGQGIDNRDGHHGVEHRIKAQEDHCVFNIADPGLKAIELSGFRF